MCSARKATGGAWDPTSRPLYFISSNPRVLDHASEAHDALLIPVNTLRRDTFEQVLGPWLDAGRLVLLDSGVFTLGMDYARAHGMDFHDVLRLPAEAIDGYDELVDTYRAIVRRFGDRLWGYVEIDQGDTDAKRARRFQFEAEGLAPIPVYHPITDPYEYFDELASQYDRICVGNMAHSPEPVRKRVLATLWERRAQYPHLWIHVLGYTPDECSHAYPMHSADSSTFLASVRWGRAHINACNASFSNLGPGFNYDLGADPDGGRGYHKAWQMAGYVAHHEQRAWRRYDADLAALGLANWPKGRRG